MLFQRLVEEEEGELFLLLCRFIFKFFFGNFEIFFLKKSVSHAPREPSIKEDEDERSSSSRKTPPVHGTKQQQPIIAPTATISTTGIYFLYFFISITGVGLFPLPLFHGKKNKLEDGDIKMKIFFGHLRDRENITPYFNTFF